MDNTSLLSDIELYERHDSRDFWYASVLQCFLVRVCFPIVPQLQAKGKAKDPLISKDTRAPARPWCLLFVGWVSYAS